MTQIALKFAISDGGADTVIVGMRNPDHVIENLKSADINLTDEEIAFLKTQRWIRNFYPEDV